MEIRNSKQKTQPTGPSLACEHERKQPCTCTASQCMTAPCSCCVKLHDDFACHSTRSPQSCADPDAFEMKGECR
eukprot:541968-Rhodomonas_salina.1